MSPSYYPPAFRSTHDDGESDDDSDGSDDSANGSEVHSTDSEGEQIESFVVEWKRLFKIHIPNHLWTLSIRALKNMAPDLHAKFHDEVSQYFYTKM